MNPLRLNIDDKKEIVLDELKQRSPRLKMESITSFVERVMSEYRYKPGSDRYFWKAIKELEQEGKVMRLRIGKKKALFLVEGRPDEKEEKKFKQLPVLEKRVKARRPEIIKDFLSSWEAYDLSA